MKLLIAVCTIFVLSFINSSEADCTDNSWVAVKNIDTAKLLGRWYAVLRFENGKDDNSDCLWHDLRRHPTQPNAIQDGAHRSFKTGRSHTQQGVDGAITYTNANKADGKMNVAYKKGGVVDKIVTALDYDDFGLIRACFEGEELFWAYSRNQYPSNDTLTKIYKEIDAQGIDTTKLIESCTNVAAADIA